MSRGELSRGELCPPSLVINSLAAKPGFGRVCWQLAGRAPAAGDANLESDTRRGDGPAGFVIDRMGVFIVIPPVVLRAGESEPCCVPASTCSPLNADELERKVDLSHLHIKQRNLRGSC